MINTSGSFTRLNINQTSQSRAVQNVSQLLDSHPLGVVSGAIDIVNSVAHISVNTSAFNRPGPATPMAWATIFTQSVIEYCIKQNHDVDPHEAEQYAWTRATKFITSQQHQWMFTTADQSGSTSSTNVVASVDVAVPVNTDGSIKKGGKEKIATALYHKFLADKKARNELPTKGDNQAFIAILMKELSMSKAGASTYAFNMRKRHGTQAS
jgi:hypothetical protein